MSENPFTDGKIRSTADGVVPGTSVFSIAILASCSAPFAWYWRIVIFVVIMFLISLIYPKVQFALVKLKASSSDRG